MTLHLIIITIMLLLIFLVGAFIIRIVKMTAFTQNIDANRYKDNVNYFNSLEKLLFSNKKINETNFNDIYRKELSK